MEHLRVARVRGVCTAGNEYLPPSFDALNQEVGLFDRNVLVVLSPGTPTSSPSIK
jgi:hypothetical protein